MNNFSFDHVIGIPFSSFTIEAEGLPAKSACVPELNCPALRKTSYLSTQFKQNKFDFLISHSIKFSKKADSYARGMRDHVSLGPKISETVKGKLRLGAKILQARGLERVFRLSFRVREEEKLLKAFQCYLSTTAGPIAGLLYISTEMIAFHSERSLKFTSPKGIVVKAPYKVLSPLERIRRANPRENGNRPNEKYIQIVTMDDFEFWFMGFIGFQRCFKCLHDVISEAQMRV